MSVVKVGKVAPIPKGVWSSTTAYDMLNMVNKSGSLYIAKRDVEAGTSVTSSDDWMKATGNLSIGTITTVSSSTPADADIIDGTDGQILNLKIPRGVTGNESIDDSKGFGDTDYVWSADRCWGEKSRMSAYLDEMSANTDKGIITIYPEFVPGQLSNNDGEIYGNYALQKTTKFFSAPYDLSITFTGTLRYCKYELDGTFVLGEDTSNANIKLVTGYKYRLSTPKDNALTIYYDSGTSKSTEILTKNLSPSDKAMVVTEAGAINTTSGNNGYFGNVVAGKTYTFSAIAYKRTNINSNISLRLQHDSTYATVEYLYTNSIPVNTNTFLYTVFKAEYNGYITLNGGGFVDDYEHDILHDCQLEEGNIPTPYVPYNVKSSIDYVARAMIEQWTRRKELPFKTGIKSIAHQGFKYYGAESNTLQAFVDAKIAGFDMIETDVRMTSDRIPVISHDPVRTTINNVDVTISETTYEALSEMQFYTDASIKIPTLWEVLNICNEINIGIMLEFKINTITQAEMTEILNIIKGLPIYVSYTSFSGNMLTLVRTIDESADINFVYSTVPTIQDLQTGSNYQNVRDALTQKGLTSICCNFTTTDWIESARKLGFAITLDFANNDVHKNYLPYAYFLVSNKATAKEYLQ